MDLPLSPTLGHLMARSQAVAARDAQSEVGVQHVLLALLEQFDELRRPSGRLLEEFLAAETANLETALAPGG